MCDAVLYATKLIASLLITIVDKLLYSCPQHIDVLYMLHSVAYLTRSSAVTRDTARRSYYSKISEGWFHEGRWQRQSVKLWQLPSSTDWWSSHSSVVMSSTSGDQHSTACDGHTRLITTTDRRKNREKQQSSAEFAVWGKITKKYMYTHFWRPKPLWKLSSAYSELCGRVCRWWDFILICSAVLTLQVTTDGQTNRVAVALVYRAACSTSFGKNDDVCAWQKTEQ